MGTSQKWFAVDFDDSQWKKLEAGIKWEEQGFREGL